MFVFLLFLSAVLCSAPKKATVAVLDKVTASVEKYTVSLEETATHGSLSFRVHSCYQPDPSSYKKASGPRCFVSIYEKSSSSAVPKLIFGRWMYQNYANLSALEHKRYDVWMVQVEGS